MKQLMLNIIKNHSKDNPIYSKQLEGELNLKGPEIRGVICELRREGFPVCSDESGYFYSEDPAVIHETVMQLKCRLISLNETARAMEHTEYRYRMKVLNQAEMFNEEGK